MPQINLKIANFKRWYRKQAPVVKYGSLILSTFLIIIVASIIDWRAVLGLRAADSCPAILGTPSMGKITVTSDVTLVAADYINGIVDCSETDIEIEAGVTVTLQGYDNGDSDWTNDYGITWQVFSLDVNTGAYVSADGTGYSATRGQGLGETGIGTTAGGGGGYGGAGGEGQAEVGNPSTEGGSIYGVVTSPEFMGSGGGHSGGGSDGGDGGGFAKIVSDGTVTINGKISADGADSTSSATSSGGAGSGGTVFIEATTLAGSGLVQSSGGDSADTTYRGGGGGGGRVVMYGTSSNSFTGDVYANGGIGGMQNGQDGTIIGPTCYPNVPVDSTQYETSVAVENELNVGDATASTTVVFEMTISDVDATDTLYPQVEIAEIGHNFTNTPTATGTGIGYTGTPVIATVAISNITSSRAYHWQARVKDEAGAVSDWVSFGANGENEDDFIVAGQAVTLEKVSGDNQSGMVTTQLAASMRVRVVDGSGYPVPNYSIDWSVLQGGGSLSIADGITNRTGYAETYLTLGTEAGSSNNRVQSVHIGLVNSPMVFMASADADATDHYAVIAPSSTLINTDFEITVTAKDQYDNTVTGATNSVDLSAVLASDIQQPGTGNLIPTSTTLVNGTMTVTTTRYDTEESIKVKALDASAKVGYSNAVAVVTSYGTCPDADGIIDTNQTWTATLANGGVFDCTGVDIHVTTGAVLTLESYENGDDIYTNDFGVNVIAGSVTVDNGTEITATNTGYPHDKGPGAGASSTASGAYGGYGGAGGDDAGIPYGDVYEPTQLGSGGGYDGEVYGGGAIQLTISGALTVNGTLSSDGGWTDYWRETGCSGGSVYITADTVLGTGLITANGGPSSASGGRVAVYYKTSSSFPVANIHAYGLDGAGAGTIYIKHGSGTGGDLYVDNNDVAGQPAAITELGTYVFNLITLTSSGDLEISDEASVLTLGSSSAITGDGTAKMTSYGTIDVTPASLTIANVGLYVAGEITGVNDFVINHNGDLGLHAHTPWHAGSYTFNSITVNSGGKVSAVGYDDGDENWIDDYGVDLNLVSMTVNTGGEVTTVGLGYDGGNGPGKGEKYSSSRSGGGHGGGGGDTSWVDGGAFYGDVFEPQTLGSGAGGADSASGSGAIKLNISGDILIDGTLNAKGDAGVDGGGGAGGSIWVVANNISGTGSLTADGGNNNGGAGRVALNYTTTNTFPLANITAYGQGSGEYGGGAGTIYIKQGSGAGGDLYVDNNGNNWKSAGITEAGTYNFNEVTLTNYGHLDVTHINSNLVIVSELGIDGDSTSDLTSYGLLTIPSTFTVQKVDIGVAGDIAGGDVSFTVGEALGNAAGLTLYAHTERKEGISYNEFDFGALTIESTGTMTFVGYDGDGEDYTDNDAAGNDDYGVILDLDSIDIKSGGIVTANGQGFAAAQGTGAMNNSGGAHGGYGSNINWKDAGALPYGSVTEPVTLGSGGHDNQSGGGVGGGAIKLNVANTAVINGTINAIGTGASYADAGGGAGGSVFVIADTISGSGTIVANGGTGGHETYGRSGSGGRIALYYSTSNTFPTANVMAYGGVRSDISGNGGPGTIYVKQGSIGTGGDLYVNNNEKDALQAGVVDSGDIQFNKVSLSGYGHLNMSHADSNLIISSATGLDGDGSSMLEPYGLFTIPSTFIIQKVDVGIRGDLSGGGTSLTIGEASGISAGLTLYAHTSKREGISYNEYSFGDVIVDTTGTITLVGYDGDDENPTDDDASGNDDYGVILNADNLTVEVNGSIASTGYAKETGSGAGTKVGTDYASGGGHGGYGATVKTADGGVAYGSVYEPITFGSGGGGDNAGTGGGAVKFIIEQNLIVNGSISAEGVDGVDTTGGGAGGSLWINADAVSGTGFITANGGNGGTSAFGDGGGGAGGRIAVYYTTLNSLPTSNVTAYSGINVSNPNRAGGPGLVYVKQGSGAGGDLFVNNNGNDGASAGIVDTGALVFDQISLTGYGDLELINTNSSFEITSPTGVVGDGTASLVSFGLLTIPETFNIQGFDLAIAGNLSGGSTSITVGESAGVNAGLALHAHSSLREGTTYNEFTFGDIVVENTGTITLVGYDGDDQVGTDNDSAGHDDYGVIVDADNISVATGGKIYADGKGFVAGAGTGVGEFDCGGGTGNQGAGGGHGGYGGYSPATAWLQESFGGTPYGDYSEPITLGSGGGVCGSTINGRGGGAIKLVISDAFVFDGIITANGTDQSGADGGGGGAGGSVWVSADTISGAGSIQANGALGQDVNDGGGSGGRVAICYTTSSTLTSTSIQTYGAGADVRIAGPGTIFINKTDEYGSLYIDNNNVTGAALAGDFEAGDYYLKDVVIGDNIKIMVKGQTTPDATGVAMNLTGNFTIGAGAYLDGAGQGFVSGEGPGAGGEGSIAGGGDGSGGGGAAHGGDGGIGEDDGVNGTSSGGSSYGNSSDPLTLGSGGGASGAGALGGAGGGALGIYAFNGIISINGTVNVDGNDGLTSSPGGGGGAGGSILLKGQELILGTSSVLTAQGGTGGNDIFDGGGGGGGRIAILYGDDGYSAAGTVSDDSGTGYQDGQEGTTLGPLGYPNIPEDMEQLEPDDMTIPVGGTTPETEVKLKFLASDADATDTLTPEIEIRPIGVAFTNVATHTGGALAYAGTPVEAEVNVAGLVLGSSYHWQARVQDLSGIYSSWLAYGDNSEAQADFIVTEATQYILTPSVESVSAGGYLSLTVSAQDDSNNVDTAYRGTVHFTSSDPHADLPSDYTFTEGDAGEHTFTNGVGLNTIGSQTITGTDASTLSLNGSTSVTVLPTGAISRFNSSVDVAPSSIENDGTETATVTVTVIDDGNNPVIGTTAVISATGSGNTITQPVLTTDEDGKAYGTIASTVIEEKIISATAGPSAVIIDDTATLVVEDTTPPVISDIQITSITRNAATISWTTNESTSGQVEYGNSTGYGSATDYDSRLNTAHSVTLAGLVEGVTYHFRILARDAYLNEALSSDQTFTTIEDLVINTFIISDISTTSAKIVWSTNIAASAVLSYGDTTDMNTQVTISEVAESHSHTITGLVKGTTYYVKVLAIRDSLSTESEVKNFITLVDENAVRITDIEITNIAGTSATVSFNTSKMATTIIRYGKTHDYEGGELRIDTSALEHAFDLIDLEPDTEYFFILIANDVDGYETTSAEQFFRTTSLAEVLAIVGVEAEPVVDGLQINWGTTHPAICYVEYGGTPNYTDRSESVESDSLNRYEVTLGLVSLENLELHYRIVCNSDEYGQAMTRDYVFSTLRGLPLTGDDGWLAWLRNNPFITAMAEYVVPGLFLISLLLQLLSLLATLGGLANIFKNFGAIWGAIFDKDKKRRGWGTVYDLHKKDPVPFAIVRLLDAKTAKVVEETVSDLKGRYRFMPKDGTYRMSVHHQEYLLPEAKMSLVKGQDLTGKYLGGEIVIKDGVSVGYNIPLISIAMAEQDNHYRSVRETIKIFFAKYGTYINIIGGILLVLSIIIIPKWWNWVILFLNLALLALFLIVKLFAPKTWGRAYQVTTLKPIKGAFVRVFDKKGSKLINSTITDEKGRYGFLSDAGEYLIAVESEKYSFPGRLMKAKIVESKMLGKVLSLSLKKDEVIKQNLPMKKRKGFKKAVGKKMKTPFGK